MSSVLITGTSNPMGIGQALVRNYLAQGWTVFAAARKPVAVEDHPNLVKIDLDVTKIESVRAAAEIIKSKAGTLDVLISNATATNGDGNLPIDEGMDLEHMLNAYDVNAVGFLRMIQTFLPIAAPGAKFAAISSEQGSMGHCWRDSGIDYGAAKAALNYCALVAQRRLGPKGYRVLAIHPGWVQTHPAPPKADLTSEESAAHIAKTIANPPAFNAKYNFGVYLNYDGANFPF